MEERKIVLFIATTLDGYIATLDHDLTWLFNVEGEGDNGISAFYDTIDTILMGRVTYDWIIKNHAVFPYQDKKCFVFSRSQQSENNQVQYINEPIGPFLRKLKRESGKKIWIMGGSQLIAQVLAENVLDELVVTIAPVLLGNGIPLFHERDMQTNLILNSVKRFNQFVELHYAVKKE